MTENNSIYIKSIEASDIYTHMYREQSINDKYCGMIPYSLELIKLKKEGLNVQKLKQKDKFITNDIINVKFKQKVKSGKEIITDCKKKISKIKKTLDMTYKVFMEIVDDINKNCNETDKRKLKKQIRKYLKKNYSRFEIRGYYKYLQIERLERYIDYIQGDLEINQSKWEEVKNFECSEDSYKHPRINDFRDLRQILYDDGFTITTVDKKTGEIITDTFVVYKRSSSKSRTGQCLFIKKELYDKMLHWSRMFLDINEKSPIDYPSMLAYESLVGSSIEDTLVIHPENMLIVSDVYSVFNQKCKVVRKNKETGFLDSYEEDTTLKNCLFDGESLLQSDYFNDGQSMKLLRNHFFKSASFACDIQKYLRDNCPEGIAYEDWKIPDMFGNLVYAKDIHIIFTPTSLKALKFSKLVGEEKDMYEYWKQIVKQDDCIFGVCKHEKESKRGHDENGNILQQTSYQMLNSMPFEESDIDALLEYEKYYIDKLKNDIDTFIDYISNNANISNSNAMWVDLYKTNSDIMYSPIFKDFRKTQVNKYVSHIKSGKIKLVGDYCILLGNGLEFLKHAIGKLPVKGNVIDKDYIGSLTGNQIYTKLFETGREYVCFRNPHTSPSNVLIGYNQHVVDIDKYFVLSKNIVCVNAIGFAIQDILSGCDYDSDNCVVFDNFTLLKVAHKCYGKYLVTKNDVKCTSVSYEINNKAMAKIDNKLATSQMNIGTVVNLGQLCMSTYWHLLKQKGTSKEVLDDLLKKVDIMTVLSSICIDLAKKFYDIDIYKEIENVRTTSNLLKEKPLFWKIVSGNENIKNNITKYDCPMDYLNKIMSNLKPAKDIETKYLNPLFVERSIRKGDRGQEDKILDYVDCMCSEINSLYADYKSKKNITDDDTDEKNEVENEIIKEYNWYMNHLKVTPDTMYAILKHMVTDDYENCTRLMNILYTTQKDVFLGAFKSIK